MNRIEHYLSCLAEECCEVGQRVSKANRFGLDEIQPGQELNNAERIWEEFNDLISVYEILRREGILPDPIMDADKKQEKIEKFIKLTGVKVD